MHIHLLAVGTRMPGWINAGFKDYMRRLPPEWGFVLKTISISNRGSSALRSGVVKEGDRLLAALPRNSYVLALDVRGEFWSTEELVAQIEKWQRSRRDVTLMIGGPDGLAPACIERADQLWSLSRLTLPHALARIVVIEQLYRAWTIMCRHPYHR